MDKARVSDQSTSLQKLSSSFLHNLINSSVDAVIAVNRSGNILIFNDAASDILGYSKQTVLDSFNIEQLYPENEAKEVMRKLRSNEYGGKGKLKYYMTNLKTSSGELVPIQLNASIIYNDNEEIATIGFFHDLREDLQIKKKLEEMQIQLLQAEKMSSLGKLAAGVAHQLNNPLNGITLFTKLVMEEYPVKDKIRKDLNRILQDAERCRDIIKELLEFARQTKQNIQPLDINKAVLRTLFLLEDQTLFHNIKISKNLSPDLPMVPVDRRQIYHVFMNIILNAAEAMDGNGTLEVSSCRSPDGNGARIIITDSGPGIREDVINHIFEPFFTTKDEGKGTGLGLSVVYGIVKNHHGKIWAESTLGEGTTFFIEFPLSEENV